MSIEHIAAALKLEHPSTADKIVLIGISNHADPVTGWAFPGIATLMRYSALTDRGVQLAIKRLVAARLIEVSRTSGKVNCYRVLTVPLAKLTPAPRSGVPPKQVRDTPERRSGEPLLNPKLKPDATRARENDGPLSPEWWPDDIAIAQAKKDFPNVDIDCETHRFRDTNERDGTIVNRPHSAWRAWIGRAEQFAKRDASRARPGTGDRSDGDRLRALASKRGPSS